MKEFIKNIVWNVSKAIISRTSVYKVLKRELEVTDKYNLEHIEQIKTLVGMNGGFTGMSDMCDYIMALELQVKDQKVMMVRLGKEAGK